MPCPTNCCCWRRRDKVALVTLNRPDKRNALSIALRYEIDQCLAELEADDAVSVVVVAGAGPSFCAGFDRNEFFVQTPEHQQALDGFHRPLPPAPDELRQAAGGGHPRPGPGRRPRPGGVLRRAHLRRGRRLRPSGDQVRGAHPLRAPGGGDRRRAGPRPLPQRPPHRRSGGAAHRAGEQGGARPTACWTRLWRWPTPSPRRRWRPSRPSSG